MRIALVCLVAYLANGPAECSGKREGDWPKMTRDSKINGLHGSLNASSVSEKDHTQTNVVEARFRKGHALARLLQPSSNMLERSTTERVNCRVRCEAV